MKPPTTFNKLRCSQCNGDDLDVSVASSTDGESTTTNTVWFRYECRDCGCQGRREVTAESLPAGLRVGDRRVVER